jgi:hypothetical protein
MNLKYQFIKTDDGQIIIKKPDLIARKLKALKPGFYNIEVYMHDERLSRMKKYYFVMESKMALHLGMKKQELHKAIKESTTMGRKLDEETGEEVYESISDIKDSATMLARIYEFQQWAAAYHDYHLEPYIEHDADGSHEDTTARLGPDQPT